jgi:2-amino-4-hydroxy-6-hydroxymethyldihydropteridine diphosphokinase
MQMQRVYIALGANIEPEHHTSIALDHLSRQLELVAMSTFYYTNPIGSPGQPEFLNGVVLVHSDMSAYDIKFRVLRPVETALGRIRSRDPYAARPIDLDILLYGEECICETQLVIPDPDLTLRPFLAAAVLELEPEIKVPGTGLPLVEALSAEEKAALKVADKFTREMKERFFQT